MKVYQPIAATGFVGALKFPQNDKRPAALGEDAGL
jgi:hypothetical protein